jgi:hypothetical protein
VSPTMKSNHPTRRAFRWFPRVDMMITVSGRGFGVSGSS